MITFSVVARRQRKDGFWPVLLRVTKERKSAYVPTGKVVESRGKGGEVTDNFVLALCHARISRWSQRLNRVNAEGWTLAQVVEFLMQEDQDVCFSDYARRHIDKIRAENRGRTAKNYELALNHLERHLLTNKVMFSQLTPAMLERWIRELEHTARAKEMYPVCIRQVWREAAKELNDYDAECVPIKGNPWLKVKIPACDTPQKRAVSAEECREFFSAALPESKMAFPLEELGRDVAMMVLCLAGINTIDLYQMRKEDYRGGVLHYRRAKTRSTAADGAYMEMRVPMAIEPLMEKYAASEESELLFSFAERYCTADSFNANVNSGIKKVCDAIGMPRMSVYTFRHTWATTAQNDCGATLVEIGFAMSHSQRLTRVTKKYVKVDFSPAWQLNERVVDFILFSDQRSKAMAQEQADGMRLSERKLIRATAYCSGKALAKIEDAGYRNVDQVIARLSEMLPKTLPQRSMVQVKIECLDDGKAWSGVRMRGKGI